MTIKASNFPTTRPTLNLDFAKTKQLDPRITFSRASSGTYVDVNGVIQSAPSGVARFDHNPTTGESLGLLVEESRTNYVLRSDSFTDSSYWGYSSGVRVFPNQVLAPDNSFTGTLIQQDTGTSDHWLAKGGLNQQVVQTSSLYTLSVFVKKYGSTSTVTLGEAAHYDTGGSAKAGIVFNFDTEQVTKSFQWADTSQSRISAYSATKFANGWYRLSLTVIPGSDTNNQRVYPAIGPGDLTAGFTLQSIPTGATGVSGANYNSPGIADFAGNGTTGVYIWGYDVQIGSFPTSYIPTPATFTGRASTATFYDANGVIQTAASGVARSNAFLPDSSGVMRPAGLLLEAAGTNLSLRSQAPISSDVIRVTITNNSATAPDGTSTAITLTPTGTADHGWAPYFTGLTANTNYTLSLFVKAKELTRVQLGVFGTAGMVFNASTGQIISGSGTVQKLPNGWYRCSCTIASDGSGTWDARVYIQDSSGNTSYTANGTEGMYFWGFQLELGSYPTSYIPTTTSTVTRAADVSSSATVTRSADVASITGANFSGFYRADEGTTFCGFRATASTSGFYENVFSYAIGTASGQQAFYRNNSNTSIGYGALGVGVPGVTVSNWLNTSHKAAGAYKTNDIALGLNGSLSTSTSATTFASSTILRIGEGFNQLPVNKYNGTIARLTYWPTRLSDATLQALTR
jgi:hypothetical protein